MKKRILFLLLTVSLVLGMFPMTGMAASQDAQNCEKLGILKGTDSQKGVDDEYLSLDTQRYQAVVIMARLLGMEDQIDAMPVDAPNFTDAEGQSGYVKKVMAFAKAHPELGFIGYEDGSFHSEEVLTAQQAYKVLLVVLGNVENQDFTWNQVFSFAGEQGLTQLSNSSTITNANLATALIEALKANMATGGKTLAEKLVDLGVIEGKLVGEIGILDEPVPLAEKKEEKPAAGGGGGPGSGSGGSPNGSNGDNNDNGDDNTLDVVLTGVTLTAETVRSGDTLTVTTSPSNASIASYIWYTVDSTEKETAIPGATGNSFVVTDAQIGYKIKVVVTEKSGTATKTASAGIVQKVQDNTPAVLEAYSVINSAAWAANGDDTVLSISYLVDGSSITLDAIPTVLLQDIKDNPPALYQLTINEINGKIEKVTRIDDTAKEVIVYGVEVIAIDNFNLFVSLSNDDYKIPVQSDAVVYQAAWNPLSSLYEYTQSDGMISINPTSLVWVYDTKQDDDKDKVATVVIWADQDNLREVDKPSSGGGSNNSDVETFGVIYALEEGSIFNNAKVMMVGQDNKYKKWLLAKASKVNIYNSDKSSSGIDITDNASFKSIYSKVVPNAALVSYKLNSNDEIIQLDMAHDAKVYVNSKTLLTDKTRSKSYTIASDAAVFFYRADTDPADIADISVVSLDDINFTDMEQKYSDGVAGQYILNSAGDEVVAILLLDLSSDERKDVYGVINSVMWVKIGSNTVQRIKGYVDGDYVTFESTTGTPAIDLSNAAPALYLLTQNATNGKVRYAAKVTVDDAEVIVFGAEAADKSPGDAYYNNIINLQGGYRIPVQSDVLVYKAEWDSASGLYKYTKSSGIISIEPNSLIWAYDTKDDEDKNGAATVVIWAGPNDLRPSDRPSSGGSGGGVGFPGGNNSGVI